jgi:glycosyltransferase involved in cell wall biosynthesis
MSQRTPKLSVLTGIYNGSANLKETIESILGQTFTDFEYILVDDGSVDNSVEIVRSFRDDRIKLVCNPVNLGLVETRNLAFELSRGEFIALTDQDDLSRPNRFDLQLKYLNEFPDVSLVATWARTLVDDTGKALTKKFRHYNSLQLQYSLLFRNIFTNSTLMMRKSSVQTPAYSPAFPLCEDYNFLIEMANSGKLALITQPLVDWRFHNHNYSTKKAQDIQKFAHLLQSQQLDKLGIQHTTEELNLHFSLAEFANPTSVSELEKVQKWLRKICCDVNITHERKVELLKVISDEWVDLAHRSTNLGWDTWKVFSNVCREHQFSYGTKSLFKLAVKCALKRQTMGSV